MPLLHDLYFVIFQGKFEHGDYAIGGESRGDGATDDGSLNPED